MGATLEEVPYTLLGAVDTVRQALAFELMSEAMEEE